MVFLRPCNVVGVDVVVSSLIEIEPGLMESLSTGVRDLIGSNEFKTKINNPALCSSDSPTFAPSSVPTILPICELHASAI